MKNRQSQLSEIASRYEIDIIYAFGSRAKEALHLLEGQIDQLSASNSDLDIGIKSKKELSLEEKVEITISLEDLFEAPKVDLAILGEVPVTLAFRIVTGEIMYRRDKRAEAEYQLYIMSMMADLLPHEKIRQKMVLGA